MWKSGRLEVTWGCAVGVALALAAGAGSVEEFAVGMRSGTGQRPKRVE